MKKGIFITFEGPEGSGKSTQIKRTAAYLKRRGRRVLLLREPGGTRVSEAIRRILLNKTHHEMVAEAELLLYLAARAQIVREKIIPALKQGLVVLCDRYEDSTLAYQGYGRGFALPVIEKMSLLARGRTLPHKTFLLDMNPEAGMRRRNGKRDRMEKQSVRFHQKVRQGFLKLARKYPKRFVVIDAVKSRKTITRIIQKSLSRELG